MSQSRRGAAYAARKKIWQGVQTNDGRRGPVELSKTRENLTDLAKELDIKVGLIYRWRRELLGKGEGSFPGNGKPKPNPEEAKIARLKKALKDADGKGHIKKGGVRFKTLKVECVYDYKFENQQTASATVFEYTTGPPVRSGTTEKDSIPHWIIEPQHRWNKF